VDIDLIGLELVKETEKKAVEEIIYQIFDASELKGYSLNICLVDVLIMKKLNYQFKKKRKITDVLSFPTPKMEKHFAHTKNLLGDVIICVEQAQLQAQEFGHTLSEEIAVLCAHGLFHLLGYDHEISKNEADIQMQGEMYLLEKASLRPELSLIGRT
jgi:probable rRNA maturation factor